MIDPQELDEQTMRSLQRVADTNVQIGKAKQALSELEATKEAFIASRETEAVLRVQTILENTHDIIRKIGENNEEITQFHNEVLAMVGFLGEITEKTNKLVSDFDRDSKVWEERVIGEENRLIELEKSLKIREISIQTERESINKMKQDLIKSERIINDKYATLERTQTRLKKHG